MAIRRGSIPADGFTIISNSWLRDARLSWKAKGLLSYIASHAPGHMLSTEQILAEGTDGRDAVRAAMRELEEHGYLRRIPLRGEGNKIAGIDYELTDPQVPINGKAGAGKPVAGPDQQEQRESAGETGDGFSGAGKPAGKKTSSQKTEKTPSASPRGTRLPADWEPSDKTLSWCLSELVPGGRWSEASRQFVRRQHAMFADYWAAAPGQKGVKLDWDATWRNWMRRAFERFDPIRPVSGPPNAKPYIQLADEYKAGKAQVEKAYLELAQQLIDNGMGATEAVKLARQQVNERVAAGESLETCTHGPYIDGVILDEEQKEVEGS